MEYNHYPRLADPISINRDEFDAAYDQFAAQNIPLKPDRVLAGRNFAGRCVDDNTALHAMAAIVMSPYTPWSSDRSCIGIDNAAGRQPNRRQRKLNGPDQTAGTRCALISACFILTNRSRASAGVNRRSISGRKTASSLAKCAFKIEYRPFSTCLS